MAITIRYLSSENTLASVNCLEDIPETAQFIWCDFNQPTEAENTFLKTRFNFNKLEIDDTVNGTPRAKYKAYNTYQYIVVHDVDTENFSAKALNIFIKSRLLITYHHQPFDILKKVETTFKTQTIRNVLPTYIFILVLDCLVDRYFEFVYAIEDKVYDFEDSENMNGSMKFAMDNVFKIRSELIKLKRVIYPMTELVNQLKECHQLLFDDKDKLYLQHIDDHMIKQQNILKICQEMTNEIKDNLTTYASYKMNRIMQVLTLVSVVFLPLTLITGIYGMNFINMPELKWQYGYYFVLVLMLCISIGCVIYFKKEKWF
ncbi:magnesium/cobalt transporter CorA [Staphylococcus cohnii]|uniref:magnesium/cobalt transporter CorA n=1 Tax=Staphylococcus cohnii TaxID=29382 RepID=UPI000CD22E4F|nr:magnesium/cobalt transporter CorA [Staphylococcus cohnii]AYX90573.1 magnesium/cobalt transporter CorA [Staphylococcus cohnii]PNZ47267.1 magnesium and cobalt transport protein CorA [Staphylococcus cohnii subsp. cohnii]GEP87032.1 magnesium transport protein CorA [Staphylococcus cohnii subsp. cohnii]SUM07011.1 Mg2+ transporter protein [Staphylococcus cohnii]